MIVSIVILILLLSVFAGLIYPIYKGQEPQIMYLFLGAMAAFFIFLIFSRGALLQRNSMNLVPKILVAHDNP